MKIVTVAIMIVIFYIIYRMSKKKGHRHENVPMVKNPQPSVRPEDVDPNKNG